VAAAQCQGHPTDQQRYRITPAEHPAMRHGDPRAGVDAERLQPLGFVGREPCPVDRHDFGAAARRKLVERHGRGVAERAANCN
jgi:hypothetical protein